MSTILCLTEDLQISNIPVVLYAKNLKMNRCSMIVLGVCLLVVTASAFPYRHRKGFGPPVVPVIPVHPVHPVPYPVYGPGPNPGFGDGLTLLTSAALLGTGNPFAQALGGAGLISTIF